MTPPLASRTVRPESSRGALGRWLLVLLLATCSGCGLIIDGAYLLSDKHTTKDVEQRRPTGQEETKPELRLAFEGEHLRVACEDVTRGVDRVWNVHKDYEYQGGFYQAHWLPVLLEGVIGGALAIGLTISCHDPTSTVKCDLVYGTIPFGVDVAYSLVRLLMIDPPKLVDKRPSTPHTEPHPEASTSNTVACDPDTLIVASDPKVGDGGLQLRVDASGWLADSDRRRLLTWTAEHAGAQIALFSARTQRTPDLSRCDFFKSAHAANVTIVIPGDCLPNPNR
jgi:hypothetical protein